MPPTDAAELMELLAGLFCGPAGETPDDDAPAADGSFLRPPLPGLDGSPQNFAAVYGPGGQLLAHMAESAETTGDVRLAELLRQISELLDDPDFQPEPAEDRPPRLVEYVYPVV